MPQVRTYSTEMQIEAGTTASFDLELVGYYHPPCRGRYLGPPEDRNPPEPSQYLIFGARARLARPRGIDPMGNPVRRGMKSDHWVDLPITLFTPDQLRLLEEEATDAFAGDEPIRWEA